MIRACFSDDYCVPTRSRSMEKLGHVARALHKRALAELVDPGVVPIQAIETLHDPHYVRSFLGGRMPLAASQNLPWSPALRTAVLAMQAGQLTATRMAMHEGIAANIANGFHHARHDRGGGFCTFNGLALIASHYHGLRVFVLDCDEHGGNGTEVFSDRLENLFNYSIFGTPFGCRGGRRSVAHRLSPADGDTRPVYTDALDDAFHRIDEWRPDLVIYQAGADCHVDDPLGRGIATTADLFHRDLSVFRFCHDRALPVLFTLAGGYQAFERTTELHVNTFIAADRVYSASSSLRTA